MDVDLAGNPGEVPTPLSEEDIQRYLRNYETAAKNAVRAGFDGVEIHGANGYLIDQFTQDVSNRRTDQWGGSVENRARFGLEVAKTITKAIGADRVGYRVSPWGTFQGMGMKDPKPQFTYLVENLAALKLAYVHGVESRTNGPADAAVQDPGKNLEFLIDAIKSKNPDTAFISAGGHTAATANETVEARKDIKMLTACGRYYISNPDLPFRWIHNLPLVKYDRNTFYAAGQKNGYIDYAYSEQYLQAKEKGSL
ncbi:hypothetical protein KEM55_006454 [Ascosphaera atra]|nr:hypothetical protein KEM55_006454 [Ascosphaera atra]